LYDDTEKTVLLVMEFVSNGCLRDYLKKNNKTNPEELLRFSFEVIEVSNLTQCQTRTLNVYQCRQRLSRGNKLPAYL